MASTNVLPIQPVDRPIICSPYEEPQDHWHYDRQSGQPPRRGFRRDAGYWYRTEKVGSVQQSLFLDEVGHPPRQSAEPQVRDGSGGSSRPSEGIEPGVQRRDCGTHREKKEGQAGRPPPQQRERRSAEGSSFVRWQTQGRAALG